MAERERSHGPGVRGADLGRSDAAGMPQVPGPWPLVRIVLRRGSMLTAIALLAAVAASLPARGAPHPVTAPPAGVAARPGEAAAAPPPPRDARAAAREEASALLELAVAGEPSVAAVQRAAAARAAPSAEDGDGWRHRARLAAMLPRVVAEYRHDQRTYHEVGLTSTAEVDFIRASPGDTVTVRLDWSLDGLVFGRSELAAAAAAEASAARRLGAAEKATRLYHERLRLRVALAASPPAAGQARAEVELELASVTAQLEALTGLYGEASR